MKISKICLNLQNSVCRTKYLFVLSHMRSRSSLLCHILGSNPDICGYSELRLSYHGRLSFIKMRYKLSGDLECKLNHKYLLDKILHDRLVVSDKVFETVKPGIIFLLREPEGTMKSIIHMGMTEGKSYKDPLKATDYYCSRLSSLEAYSRKIREKYFFIESNDLIDKTEGVLERLTRWLNLKEPLDPRYRIFRHTGERGYGDISDNIKSGFPKKTKDYHEINIPVELFRRGLSSYIKCKDSLLRGAV